MSGQIFMSQDSQRFTFCHAFIRFYISKSNKMLVAHTRRLKLNNYIYQDNNKKEKKKV